MENQQQTAQQQSMNTEIHLVLTLAEVNAILQAMHKAPYEMAKPMIDKVTQQAQEYVNGINAQRNQPTQPTTPQIPTGLSLPNSNN